MHNKTELENYLRMAVKVAEDSPVLLDRFLADATEVDVDAVSDGKEVIIAGIMEHIEQAGVHSGDSSCSLPPFSLPKETQKQLAVQMKALAHELKVVGLMNAQFAIQGEDIYILEVNPRASRTVPFVSKATGLPFAKIAARCMSGITLHEQGITQVLTPHYYSVKVSVFPFSKFLGVDPILGPEMKSTGEVMGFGCTFAEAFAKAQLAAGVRYKNSGKVFISVRDSDKGRAVELAASFVEMGFSVVATRGTSEALTVAGVPCTPVHKVLEGRPHIVDMIKNDEIDFIVNTVEGKQAVADSFCIRSNALRHKVNYTTTLEGAAAALLAFQQEDLTQVLRLQERHLQHLGENHE